MECYPLFTIACLYITNGIKLRLRKWYWVVDFAKEGEPLKLICKKFHDQERCKTPEDIINHCKDSETIYISSAECNQNKPIFLSCNDFLLFNNESMKRIAVKMNERGITEDDFKKIISFENQDIKKLREIREGLKGDD